MGKFVDLTGQKFGKLTVVSRAENDKHRNAMWVCKCDCGNEHTTIGCSLRQGNTKSCGCLLKHNTFNLEYEDFIIMYDVNGYETLIDHEDYEKIKQHTWVRRSDGYFISIIGGKTIRLHRFLLQPDLREEVDHINGIPFDNRKANLRICTRRENGYNVKKCKSKTSSKYKGVCLRRNKVWFAYIVYKDKQYSLGYYETEEEAGRKYDEKAVELFGEFANLNFPKKQGR